MNSVRIIKRNGQLQNFDGCKIITAVSLAQKDTYKASNVNNTLGERVLEKVCETLVPGKDYHVFEIHSHVENALLELDQKTATTYINFRVNKDIERLNFTDSIKQVVNKDSNVVNENANKDSKQFSTMRDLLAGSVAKPVGLSMLPPRVAKAHIDGDLHWHDLDYSPFQPLTNCCIVDFETILKDGYIIGNAIVQPPKSVSTAMAQITQIIFNVASSQYGGITVERIDELLEPYIKLTWDKHYNQIVEHSKKLLEHAYTGPVDMGLVEMVSTCRADELTYKSIYDAIQGFEHEVNSLSAFSQTPFITVNFGLSTTKFGVMVQKAILNVRLQGFGPNHKTAIFPKLVFTLRDGVNLKHPDPNYNIKQLALECASKRIYPDILSYDKVVEITGDFKPPMGCLDYNETIEVSFDKNEARFETKVLPIGDFFTRMKKVCETDNGRFSRYFANMAKKRSESIACPVNKSMFEKNYRFYYDGDSFNLWAKQFRQVYGRKPTRGDFEAFVGVPWQRYSVMTARGADMSLVSRWDSYWEVKVCDVLCANGFTRKLSVNECVLPTDFVRNAFIECKDGVRRQLDIYFPIVGKAIEVQDFATHSKTSNNEPYTINGLNAYKQDYKGFKKGPEYSFTKRQEFAKLGINILEVWEDEIRHNKHLDVIAKFVEKTIIPTPEYRLVQDIETNRSVSYSLVAAGQVQYVRDIDGSLTRVLSVIRNSNVTDWVEIFTPSKRILVTTDHPLLGVDGQVVAGEMKEGDVLLLEDNIVEYVTKIHRVEKTDYSYDVETETGTFVFSGVLSHNCRSFLSTHVDNQTGKKETAGRMNLGVITLNLPRIALETNSMKEFFQLLDERLQVAKEGLDYRVKRCFQAKPDNAPILYQQGAFGKKLSSNTNVGECFIGKRATISLGYIGIYECVARFYGKDWYDNSEAIEFSVNILKALFDATNVWNKGAKVKYSVYSTPSESLTDRFVRLDLQKFGEQENITDKGYYTNSFHVDVRKQISPFEKISFESKYLPYTPGGQICYVETCVNSNTKALETLWDYAYRNVAYFGVNTPIDYCDECKFSGEFKHSSCGYYCPTCGNSDPNTTSVVKRVCGYLSMPLARPVVKGRQKEINSRIIHQKQ